mgnify:CR=1 FL=1
MPISVLSVAANFSAVYVASAYTSNPLSLRFVEKPASMPTFSIPSNVASIARSISESSQIIFQASTVIVSGTSKELRSKPTAAER